MSIFSKKKNKKEPQYYKSATNMQTLNYRVYYMKASERLMYSALAFVIGTVVGYIFYGGLARDEYGNATSTTFILNIIISSIVGLIAVKLYIPVKTDELRKKRKSELTLQFRDMLDGLTTSLSAGTNIRESFLTVRDDLRHQYDENDYIIKELEVIIVGIYNNVSIESILEDFGRRSGVEDIVSFADVFKICYSKGGNIRDVITTTKNVISDKIEIKDEIETTVAANKSEQNIMIVMPILIIFLIKNMSPEFSAKFATPSGIASTTVAVIIFVASYFLGRRILDIKI